MRKCNQDFGSKKKKKDMTTGTVQLKSGTVFPEESHKHLVESVLPSLKYMFEEKY